MQEEEEEKPIHLTEIIGKKITNIYCVSGIEDGWLDTAECFIELDGELCISIPFCSSKVVFSEKLPADAKTIFGNLSDIPTYHINKEEKSIREIAENHQKQKKKFFTWVRKLLFGYEPIIKEYVPYKVTYAENRLTHIINRTIVDYLWSQKDHERGIFKLDNGYFISETYMSPSGTGLAGLNYYENYESLVNWKGNDFSFLSGQSRE